MPVLPSLSTFIATYGYAALFIGTFLEGETVLIIAGFFIFVASVRAFVALGKGTPAPIDPPVLLVTAGPYRVIRNPMYVSGIIIIFGEFLISGSGAILLYLLFIWLMFHLFIVCYEEPHLRKIFGAPYETFCREVPRWMPRLRRTPRKRRIKDSP